MNSDKTIQYLKEELHDESNWKAINPEYLSLEPAVEYYISDDGRLFNSYKRKFVMPDIDKREDKGKGYKRYVILSYDKNGDYKRKKYPAA